MKTWRHLQNRKYTTYATPLEEDRAMDIGNTYQKFGEVRLCDFLVKLSGFRVMRADRQTSS